MQMLVDLKELRNNVVDWFNMSFIQSEYSSDNDYVDDIRDLNSYLNDSAIDLCVKDLANKYYSCYTEDQINCYRESIADFLSYEAKLVLDSFSHNTMC